jgi:hypothetical protein
MELAWFSVAERTWKSRHVEPYILLHQRKKQEQHTPAVVCCSSGTG